MGPKVNELMLMIAAMSADSGTNESSTSYAIFAAESLETRVALRKLEARVKTMEALWFALKEASDEAADEAVDEEAPEAELDPRDGADSF